MSITIIGLVGALGAVLGSFAGAQVWRLRARQLVDDEKSDEEVDRVELKRLKPLLGKSFEKDRSQCLNCKHELIWYDLLPIVSWIGLGGKCRYCKKPIGITEILLELAMAIVFAASVAFWPSNLAQPLEATKLLLWLVALVALAINFVYDLKWSLLVAGLNWLVIGCGVVFAAIVVYQSPEPLMVLGSLLGAVMILGGLYAVLWLLSRGKWVGDGDIYLGTGLALFLSDWTLAFIALFLANFIGTIIVLPSLLNGKMRRGSHLPFGPLLIIGGILAWFIGPAIVDQYQQLILF